MGLYTDSAWGHSLLLQVVLWTPRCTEKTSCGVFCDSTAFLFQLRRPPWRPTNRDKVLTVNINVYNHKCGNSYRQMKTSQWWTCHFLLTFISASKKSEVLAISSNTFDLGLFCNSHTTKYSKLAKHTINTATNISITELVALWSVLHNH